MIKQSLIIYNLPVLFNILNEIKENLKFELFNFTQEQDLSKINETIYGNYLILTNSQNKIKNQNNQLIMDKFPFKINEVLEKINIALLKQKYDEQSKVWIGQYKLDVNSREIFKKDKKLKLTERESEIILFLKNSKKSQSIENLQKEVWSHNSKLETHTVETHIYRLRKKISKIFKDENFIISAKKGYKILWKKEILLQKI